MLGEMEASHHGWNKRGLEFTMIFFLIISMMGLWEKVAYSNFGRSESSVNKYIPNIKCIPRCE